MNYSNNLDKIIKNALSELITDYHNNVSMFNSKINYKYLKSYFELKEKYNNNNLK